MSTESSSKNAGVAVFHIAINAGENIAYALRRFLTAVKYANVKYGEAHYKDYLKGNRGHRFKSDAQFARVAYDMKKSDIERIPVTAQDKEIIETMARNLNVDYCLMRRPSDLDALVHKATEKKENMTDYEKKIVTAFTIRDGNGHIIMDPENPTMPLINNAEYMLTICSTDLAKWEIITRELEIQSHKPSLTERLKQAKLINIVSRIFTRNKEQEIKEPIQEYDKQEIKKEKSVKIPQQEKSVTYDSNYSATKKLLYYILPKVKSYEDFKAACNKLGFHITDKNDLGDSFEFTADSTLFPDMDSLNEKCIHEGMQWMRLPNSHGKLYVQIPNDCIQITDKSDGDGYTAHVAIPTNITYLIANTDTLLNKDVEPILKERTVQEFKEYWEDKTKNEVFQLSMPNSNELVDINDIKKSDGNSFSYETIKQIIQENERDENANAIQTLLSTENVEDLSSMKESILQKANIHLKPVVEEQIIEEKNILSQIDPKISMKKALDFLIPKVMSYEDLKESLELIGFSIRDRFEGENMSLDDLIGNQENLYFKVINMDTWMNSSELIGNDGLDYSLNSIVSRIEENSRSNNVQIVQNLLDSRDVDEIEKNANLILDKANIKVESKQPVISSIEIKDKEFINSLNATQLRQYISHISKDDPSKKYALDQLNKMSKPTQKREMKKTISKEEHSV